VRCELQGRDLIAREAMRRRGVHDRSRITNSTSRSSRAVRSCGGST
jgi:hypothetical protein